MVEKAALKILVNSSRLENDEQLVGVASFRSKMSNISGKLNSASPAKFARKRL